MDTQSLSIDKKEENNGVMQQSAVIPAAVPSMPASAKNQPKNGGEISAVTEQASDIRPVSDVLAEPESSTENPSKKKRAFVSAGEHIDHWSKYLTVDWIWNATSSACFAYWGKFTESGKKLWNDPVDKGFNLVLKPIIKNPENLKAGVRWGNTFSSIIMGGLMFTIPPLLVLESKKVKLGLVKFYDSLVYGKDKVENDPKFQQAYSEIENAPKKGFWSNFISRYIALAPLLASVIYKPSREWLSTNVFSHVATGTKKVLSTVGLTPERLFKKFPAAEREKRWNYINNEALSMDLAFGLPYAVMHAFFYNMLANTFAGWKAKSKKDEAVNQAAGNDSKISETAVAAIPTVVTEVSADSAPAQDIGKKWANENLRVEQYTPAPHVIEKAADNFVDKVADKSGREQQIV